MESVRGRITGTEMEWPIAITVPQPDNQKTDVQETVGPEGKYLAATARSYLSDMPFIGSDVNCFLSNGARFYRDCGKQEYASPEDDSFLGTVANELASEQIMRSFVEHLPAAYDNQVKPDDISLHRRVVDSVGHSWGYHENYAIHPSVSITEESLALLGVHVATRAVITGAGAVTEDGSYRLAQKLPQTTSDFQDSTLEGRGKPVVNLRQQPHASVKYARRIHVTSGDATMSPWATRMNLGTTSLVLRLIEHGKNLDDLRFEDPLHVVAAAVAGDVEMRQRYRLQNGRALGAIAVQRALFQASRRLARNVTLPEEELWTLTEWEKACADLEQDPMLLKNRADWAAKYHILKHRRDKHGTSFTTRQMQATDRQWDVIDDRGFGMMLRETAWSDWMPPQDLIDERTLYPPATTRANIRGTFVSHFSGTHKSIDVDWHRITYNGRPIKLDNPWDSHNSLVDKLIRKQAA